MIEAKNIVKRYGDLEVLRNVSVTINDGEIVAIVGPSGAGKTTLLQIIGTLDAPQSGQVLYDGTDVLKLKQRELAKFRNKNIGFVFQFHQLLPEFTTLENVAIPALIGGEKKSEAYEKARQLLDYLGLGQRLEHKPAQLSGGERQRAAVARALINNPSLVLADEPTGNLDPATSSDIMQLLVDINRQTGTTMLISSHDFMMIDKFQSRMLVCENGSLFDPQQ